MGSGWRAARRRCISGSPAREGRNRRRSPTDCWRPASSSRPAPSSERRARATSASRSFRPRRNAAVRSSSSTQRFEGARHRSATLTRDGSVKMHAVNLAERIDELWAAGELEAGPVEEAIGLLDAGELRVAEPRGGAWVVNEWAKKAILLYFKLRKVEPMDAGAIQYLDKIPLKTDYA